ncbi:hypothetical protein VTO42DRAFT_2346 [Malbranchea cinnamomea]
MKSVLLAIASFSLAASPGLALTVNPRSVPKMLSPDVAPGNSAVSEPIDATSFAMSLLQAHPDAGTAHSRSQRPMPLRFPAHQRLLPPMLTRSVQKILPASPCCASNQSMASPAPCGSFTETEGYQSRVQRPARRMGEERKLRLHFRTQGLQVQALSTPLLQRR